MFFLITKYCYVLFTKYENPFNCWCAERIDGNFSFYHCCLRCLESSIAFRNLTKVQFVGCKSEKKKKLFNQKLPIFFVDEFVPKTKTKLKNCPFVIETSLLYSDSAFYDLYVDIFYFYFLISISIYLLTY